VVNIILEELPLSSWYQWGSSRFIWNVGNPCTWLCMSQHRRL